MKKNNYIIVGCIIILLIGTVTAILILKNNKETDAIKFSKEYTSMPKENVFVYKSANEIIQIMEHGTGIVYLGFPECPWCTAYVKYLNEVALDVGIDEIYYYNILEDRQNNTKEYQKIISLLGDNLQYDNEGKLRIYVPNVSFHIKGEVIANDYETSYDTHGYKTPEEYWTPEEVSDLKARLTDYSEKVLLALNSCTGCNK